MRKLSREKMSYRKIGCCCILAVLAFSTAKSAEYHVSVEGSVAGDGSLSNPFRTITAAAEIAQPGDVITVRGFTMTQAATPWAPPSAEQIGLVGTHWSRGWIIEDNDISYSTCAGVTLGKYGDEWDNTAQGAGHAEGYNRTIERALENGWNKETVGHQS